MPSTVEAPMRKVRHCFLKSSRLIIVPRCTMMKPTTTPARASSDELASRSSGKMPVRKPTRKISEATNSELSSDLVFFATYSLTVHTAMTTTNASTGFARYVDLHWSWSDDPTTTGRAHVETFHARRHG